MVQTDWSRNKLQKALTNFLMTYRSTQHTTTGETPAALFLKREIRMKFDLLHPSIKEKVKKSQNEQKEDHDKKCKDRQFRVDQEVMVRNYRGDKWVPGIIIERKGQVTYLVKVGDKEWKRHADQIVNKEIEESGPTESASI